MKNTQNIGLWYWVYDTTTAPKVDGLNLKIQYNGFALIADALAQQFAEQSDFESLLGEKYLSLGGGPSTNYPGCSTWTTEVLQSNTKSILNGDINDFDGIAFDIEIGDSGLEQDFELCFAALKQMGKKVIVSVSFSSPYSIDDSESLMESILLSENVDLLSPQLYQNGNESAPSFDDPTTPWSTWAKSNISIAPSIVDAAQYPVAQKWFSENCGIKLAGFIQWNNLPPTPPPPPTPGFDVNVTIQNNTQYNIVVAGKGEGNNPTGDFIAPGAPYTWKSVENSNHNLYFNLPDSPYPSTPYLGGSVSFGPTSGVYVDRGWMSEQSISMIAVVNNVTFTQTENGGDQILQWNQFEQGGNISLTFNNQ